MNKVKDYLQLTKPSLNIMVVFSSVVSFMLTPGFEHYTEQWKWILLHIGKFAHPHISTFI